VPTQLFQAPSKGYNLFHINLLEEKVGLNVIASSRRERECDDVASKGIVQSYSLTLQQAINKY